VSAPSKIFDFFSDSYSGAKGVAETAENVIGGEKPHMQDYKNRLSTHDQF